MGDEVTVEKGQVFPATMGRRYTITIPLNIRKLLASRGVDLDEGDQVFMAFVEKDDNAKASNPGSE